MKVLLIEDDAALQDSYSFILKQAGHDVTSAFNGAEGLEAVKKEAYDIILLDLHMPVMNGYEFLEQYTERDKKTKIILFTNMLNADVAKQAEKYGVHKSILKSSMTPIDLLDLISSL